MEGSKGERMEGSMDGSTDGSTEGRTEGTNDGGIEGRTDAHREEDVALEPTAGAVRHDDRRRGEHARAPVTAPPAVAVPALAPGAATAVAF